MSATDRVPRRLMDNRCVRVSRGHGHHFHGYAAIVLARLLANGAVQTPAVPQRSPPPPRRGCRPARCLCVVFRRVHHRRTRGPPARSGSTLSDILRETIDLIARNYLKEPSSSIRIGRKRSGSGTSPRRRRRGPSQRDLPVLEPTPQHTEQGTGQGTGQRTGQGTDHVERLVAPLTDEMGRGQLQTALKLTHRPHFITVYLRPALEAA